MIILADDIESPRVEYFLWVGGDFTGVHPALGLAHVGQPEHHEGAGAHHGLETLGIFGVQQLRILPVEGKEDLGIERYKVSILNIFQYWNSTLSIYLAIVKALTNYSKYLFHQK